MENKTVTPTEKKADYSTNWMVFWVLAILTAAEYYLGINSGGRAGGFLVFFGFLKAGFVVANYMNLRRLFVKGESH